MNREELRATTFREFPGTDHQAHSPMTRAGNLPILFHGHQQLHNITNTETVLNHKSQPLVFIEYFL
jgi:hypothetical protein